MSEPIRLCDILKTGEHQARIAVLSNDGVSIYDVWLERPMPDDPDIRTFIHLVEQGVDGLPDDLFDWLVEEGLHHADIWEFLRFDRDGNPQCSACARKA